MDSDLSGGQRYPAFEQPGPSIVASRQSVQLFLALFDKLMKISGNFRLYNENLRLSFGNDR